MKTRTFKSIIFLLLICFPNLIFSQTNFYGGPVSGIWTLEGSPYRIFDHVTIPDDSTLNIEGGVRVEFQGHYTIQVQGNIQANGTPEDSIFFTVNDTTGFSNPDLNSGGWGGVRIIDINTENDSSIFEYCVFEYGKAIADYWHDNAGGALCIIRFNKIRISNCLFNRNMATGTEVPSGGAIHLAWSDIKLELNKFEYNEAVSGGAIQMHESNPTFKQNIFINNHAYEGGGISVGGLSNPTFEKDSILGNQATELGGGIMCWDKSDIIFDGVVVQGNSAPWGGGLGLAGIKGSFDECTINENTAVNLGGGIASDFSHVTITNSIITSNSASMSGGIHAWYDTLEIDNCQITSNLADYGGGLHSDFSQLSLKNSSFSENSAINGGGVHLWNCDLKVESSLFNKNMVQNESGAIECYFSDTLVFNRPYHLTIEKSQFIENDAAFRSGAIKLEQIESDTSFADIFLDQIEFRANHAERVAGLLIRGNFKEFVLSNSKFSSNKTDLWNGGASFTLGCTGQIVNCEFTDNEASLGDPGASGVSGGSYVHYINCTFADNTAGNVGGLSVHRDGKASITNSIFWNNRPNQISVRGIRETDFSELFVNYCDVEFSMDSIEVDTLAELHWGTGNITADPLFQDKTNGNYRLKDDSPCIDAGVDSITQNGILYFVPLTDMDGFPRPQDGATLVDMGAYENQNVLALLSQDEPDNFLINTYPNPLRDHLNINLSLNQPYLVSISIYDYTGCRVIDLLQDHLGKGSYHFTWDPGDTKIGMYICQIKIDNQIKSQKILLIP